jgi:hypothetical protein
VFGGGLLFAVGRMILRGQPIPWSIEFPSSFRTGVFTPHANPKAYWAVALLNLVLFLSVLSGSVWMLCNAGRAASALDRFSESHAGNTSTP